MTQWERSVVLDAFRGVFLQCCLHSTAEPGAGKAVEGREWGAGHSAHLPACLRRGQAWGHFQQLSHRRRRAGPCSVLCTFPESSNAPLHVWGCGCPCPQSKPAWPGPCGWGVLQSPSPWRGETPRSGQISRICPVRLWSCSTRGCIQEKVGKAGCHSSTEAAATCPS